MQMGVLVVPTNACEKYLLENGQNTLAKRRFTAAMLIEGQINNHCYLRIGETIAC
jgi:hypothetical protein